MFSFTHEIVQHREDEGYLVIFRPDDPDCTPFPVWCSVQDESEIPGCAPQHHWLMEKRKVDPDFGIVNETNNEVPLQNTFSITMIPFVVVNNPDAKGSDPSEFDFDGAPFQLVMDEGQQPIFSMEAIYIPHYRVAYTTMPDGEQNFTISNPLHETMTLIPEEKVTSLSSQNQALVKAGLDICYSKHFSGIVPGAGNVSIISTDIGDTIEMVTKMSPKTPAFDMFNLCGHDAIGVVGNQRIVYTGNPVGIVYLPFKAGKRFDLAYTDDLHQFDVYGIKAGASQDTATFAAGTTGLLHVIKGSVAIGDFTVSRQEFYEQDDPTKSVTITAIEDATVIYSVKI